MFYANDDIEWLWGNADGPPKKNQLKQLSYEIPFLSIYINLRGRARVCVWERETSEAAGWKDAARVSSRQWMRMLCVCVCGSDHPGGLQTEIVAESLEIQRGGGGGARSSQQ